MTRSRPPPRSPGVAAVSGDPRESGGAAGGPRASSFRRNSSAATRGRQREPRGPRGRLRGTGGAQDQGPAAGLLAVRCSRGRSESRPCPRGLGSGPTCPCLPAAPSALVTGPLTVHPAGHPEAALGPGAQPPRSAQAPGRRRPFPAGNQSVEREASLLLRMQTPVQGRRDQEEPGQHDALEGTNTA